MRVLLNEIEKLLILIMTIFTSVSAAERSFGTLK